MFIGSLWVIDVNTSSVLRSDWPNPRWACSWQPKACHLAPNRSAVIIMPPVSIDYICSNYSISVYSFEDVNGLIDRLGSYKLFGIFRLLSKACGISFLKKKLGAFSRDISKSLRYVVCRRMQNWVDLPHILRFFPSQSGLVVHIKSYVWNILRIIG